MLFMKMNLESSERTLETKNRGKMKSVLELEIGVGMCEMN